MADLWEAVIAHTLLLEGGYVNDPRDSGGETKFGISKRSYPYLHIAQLTREEAIAIYRRDYWARVPVELPDGMRWMVFDACVNHGTSRALGWLAEYPTLLDYVSNRIEFYVALSNWPTFGKGWMRRVASVLLVIGEWERLHGPADRVSKVALLDLSLVDRITTALVPKRAELDGSFVYHRAGSLLEVKRV
jgi:lysozyme family protein